MTASLKEPLALVLSFLVPFAVYCLTLAPSVTFTDSGELAAACLSLGVAHPTGYPLFVTLGHLWSLLPLPFAPIFKLNLFAAFCVALASALFFKLSRFVFALIREKTEQDAKETKKKKSSKNAPAEFALDDDALIWLSLATSLAFAFARTIWAQATAIEVYSLHLVMLNLSLLLFLRFATAKETRLQDALVWALALGLGFGNHLTMILLAPATLYLFFHRFGFGKEAWRLIALMAIPFLVGLSIYLYLPIRSAMTPEFNWGETHRGFDKFFYHVSGKQYQIHLFNGNWQPQAKMLFSLLPFELAFVGIPLAIYGAAKLFQRRRALGWFFSLLVLGGALYAVNYNVHDADSYFLLTFMGLILLAFVGVGFLARGRKQVAIASLLLPLVSLGLNFNHNDRRDDRLALDYAKTTAEALAPNALIISAQWDYFCSPFWYLQRFEGLRPDVIMIEKELLRRTWYARKILRDYPSATQKCRKEIEEFLEDLERFESGQPYDQIRIQTRWTAMLNALIDKNIDERPVYLTQDVLQTEPDVARAYKKIPQGFALRLSQRDERLPIGELRVESFLSATPRNHLEEGIIQTAAIQLGNAARYAYSIGNVAEAERLARLSQAIGARLHAR